MIDLNTRFLKIVPVHRSKERSTIIVLQFLIFTDKIRLVTVVIVTKIRAKTALTASAIVVSTATLPIYGPVTAKGTKINKRW